MPEVGKILLVEDDPCDVELTLEALNDNSLASGVVVARDGEEALDYIHRRGSFADRADGQPLVVLLDLKMPKVDGVEVARRLKSDPQTRSIPVVILTSSRESRDLRSCYEIGVNAYVVKPVQFHEFSDAVRQVGRFWVGLNELPPGHRGGQKPAGQSSNQPPEP